MTVKAKSPKAIVAIILLIWGTLFFASSDPEKANVHFLLSYVALCMLLSLPFAAFAAMIFRFRLTINGELYYRGLIGSHTMKLSDINSVKIENGYSNIGKKFRFVQRLFLPPFRMVFYSRKLNSPALVLNRAIMSREGESDLVKFLTERRIPVHR
jgi:hypothetical protein